MWDPLFQGHEICKKRTEGNVNETRKLKSQHLCRFDVIEGVDREGRTKDCSYITFTLSKFMPHLCLESHLTMCVLRMHTCGWTWFHRRAAEKNKRNQKQVLLHFCCLICNTTLRLLPLQTCQEISLVCKSIYAKLSPF